MSTITTLNDGITGASFRGQINTNFSNLNTDKAELSGGTFTGDISVPDEAYGVGWNGSLEVPTKNAVYDEIETKQDTLVSGTNVKTVNGNSIVGSGDIVIASGGDVVGPASSTDNAIARYDATTGKLLQNSGVTIGDTNIVSGISTLNTGAINATSQSSFTDTTSAAIIVSGGIAFDGATNRRIDDGGSNELIKFPTTSVPSAVNEFTISNAATGSGPILEATGGDTNIDLNLKTKGSGVVKVNGVALSSGTGDVVGPASATDNAIARFDTTTGKLIQNSTVIVTDTGDVSGVGELKLTELRATSSAGVDVHNNSDTQIAIFGAGGGIGSTLVGTTNIGSASADYHQVDGGTGTITDTATGSSSNIDINLIPKGTGKLKVNGTEVSLGGGTATGTNTGDNATNTTYTTLATTLSTANTWSAVQTFLAGMMGLRNVANTFTSFFTNTNTASRTYTLKDASGTLAFTTDITGTNSGTNTGDETTSRINTLYGTTNAITVGSVEVGHASDTTLSRSASGQLAMEGVDLLSISNTKTVTNKRNQPRIVSAASYTTDTGTSLDFSTCDIFIVTAQAGALKFNNPSGSPQHGEKILIRCKDNGTARALTYDTQYRAIGVTLPTTTVISKTLYMLGVWNTTDTKLDILAVGQEA